MSARTKRPQSRAPLVRERVLTAAMTIADEGGVAALTMRRLGDELGVEAMSLYNHVASKEALLSGMVDLVFAEIGLPPEGGDHKAAMRARAMSARWTRTATSRSPTASRT